MRSGWRLGAEKLPNDQIKHDLWNLSNNLKAIRELLSHMYYYFFTHTGNYTNTEAAEMNSQIRGLLINIESLIEAAQAVQYVSSSTTREVLKTSVALKSAMRKYKHDLERGIEGSEDDIICMNRPSVIYPRIFKIIMNRAKQSCSDLKNLESEVEAVSLMQTEDEQPAETEQENQIQHHIAVDDKELTILVELAEGSDKTFSQVEIEAANR